MKASLSICLPVVKRSARSIVAGAVLRLLIEGKIDRTTAYRVIDALNLLPAGGKA